MAHRGSMTEHWWERGQLGKGGTRSGGACSLIQRSFWPWRGEGKKRIWGERNRQNSFWKWSTTELYRPWRWQWISISLYSLLLFFISLWCFVFLRIFLCKVVNIEMCVYFCESILLCFFCFWGQCSGILSLIEEFIEVLICEH